MRKRRIIPIVEGFGEERAVPLLLRRWLRHRNWDRFFEVLDPAINAKGCGRLKAAHDSRRHLGVEHYVRAAMRNNPQAILVVLDADKDCVNRGTGDLGLGPELLARAQGEAPQVPTAVVVANREYEAWFLANFHAIRFRGGFRAEATCHSCSNPETLPGCKGLVAELMGCNYEETVHQLSLTRLIGFRPNACRRSPSYGKLLRDLERLTREARIIGAV